MKITASILILAVMLAACGSDGGSSGGSGGSTPAPRPTAEDTAAAAAAQLKAILNIPENSVTLIWQNKLPASRDYVVEQLSGSNWINAATVSRDAFSPFEISSSVAFTGSTTFRVRARRKNYEMLLSTVSGAQQIAVSMPAATPTLAFSQSEPLHDTVGISVANAPGADLVYRVDGNFVRVNDASPAHPSELGLSIARPTTYRITATYATAPDMFTSVAQTVQIRAPDLSTGAEISGLASGRDVQINAYASSDFGIQKVEALLDGVSLGELPAAAGPFNFHFDPIAARSGTHTVVVRATASNGSIARASYPVDVANPLTLNLTAPFDGAIVNGTLNVAGTFTSDRPGGATLTGTLIDYQSPGGVDPRRIQIFTTRNSPFDLAVSLSGIRPGTYDLELVRDDGVIRAISYVTILVASSPSLTYIPFATLGVGTTVLAVDADPTPAVVYSERGGFARAGGPYKWSLDPSFYYIDFNDPSQTPRQSFYFIDDGAWYMARGTPFHFGQKAAQSAGLENLLRWNGSGLAQNLFGLRAGRCAVHGIRGSWLLAGCEDGQLQFFNIDTGVSVSPAAFDPIAGRSEQAGHNNFFESSGSLQVYYTSSRTSNMKIRRWDQASRTDIAITDGSLRKGMPQTDGIRAAWQSLNVEPGNLGYTLTAYRIADGSSQDLTTNLSWNAWFLNDGVLVWREESANSYAIKIDDGSNTATLSQGPFAYLFGVSNGFAVYTNDGKVYAARATGNPRVLLDGIPSGLWISNGSVLFSIGRANTMYVVPVN